VIPQSSRAVANVELKKYVRMFSSYFFLREMFGGKPWFRERYKASELRFFSGTGGFALMA